MRYCRWFQKKIVSNLPGVVLLFYTITLNAQIFQQDSTRTLLPPAVLSILIEEKDRIAINNIFTPKARRWENDSVFRTSDPAAFLTNCRENAYLVASLDKYNPQDTTINLFLGPRFHWISFRPADDETRRWLQESPLNNKFHPGQPIRSTLFARLETQLLEQAENSGYPFASVGLDSLVLESTGGASALLRIRPGPFFSYKKLKINGDIKIPERTVARYLGIKPDAPFSRTQILNISKQLKALPYLEQYANPTIKFAGPSATVNLYLKKKRAGRFDFIIGLLPQTNTATGNTSNLLLTGSLNATFLNALGQGERLSVELERLRVETQKLDLQTAIPYITGSPFGAEGRLNIFRRDSSWVDAMGSIGVQYLLSGANRLAIFGENRSSSLQRIDTNTIIATRQLPANLDYRQNGFGTEVEWTQLDYRFNPRKGWYLQAKGFAGFHRILRNSQITGLRSPTDPAYDFESLYTNIPERSVRLRSEMKVEGYIPLFQRTTILLRGRLGSIFSKDPIYSNEQYRLGGNKLLRGFDEESLFATKWAVTTTEWRLLISSNSFMAVFSDWGYIENITASTRTFQHPLGIGAGMNFETPAGIFGISAAVGRLNPGDGLDFRATKFHLGYVSVF
jgi:outer membrane protein assembly factor BamA